MKGTSLLQFSFLTRRSGAETEHHPRSGAEQSGAKRPCQRRRRRGGKSPRSRPRRRSNACKGGRAEAGKRRTNAQRAGGRSVGAEVARLQRRAVVATKRRTSERLQRRAIGRSVIKQKLPVANAEGLYIN